MRKSNFILVATVETKNLRFKLLVDCKKIELKFSEKVHLK